MNEVIISVLSLTSQPGKPGKVQVSQQLVHFSILAAQLRWNTGQRGAPVVVQLHSCVEIARSLQHVLIHGHMGAGMQLVVRQRLQGERSAASLIEAWRATLGRSQPFCCGFIANREPFLPSSPQRSLSPCQYADLIEQWA